MVSTNSSDCLVHLNEEAIRTAVYSADVSRVSAALRDLEAELDARNINNELRKNVLAIAPKRAQKQLQEHDHTVGSSVRVLDQHSVMPIRLSFSR